MEEHAPDQSYVNQGQVMRLNHLSLDDINRYCTTLKIPSRYKRLMLQGYRVSSL